jgi:hypothetical protein
MNHLLAGEIAEVSSGAAETFAMRSKRRKPNAK